MKKIETQITKTKNIIEPNNLKNIIDINIDYSVKIHDISTCKCEKIKNACSHIKINSTKEIVYIIEKIWDDNKHRRKPRNLFIVSEKNNIISKVSLLERIFEKHLVIRKMIHNYFTKYEWSQEISKEIRKIVNNMTSICFCRFELLPNEATCNAGIVIIGDNSKLTSISHCFNKYAKKTEFNSLVVAKLGNLATIPKKNQSHNLREFLDSSETSQLSDSLHTIIGILSPVLDNHINYHTNNNQKNDNEPQFSFSFGKREWYPNELETSFTCAKREFFEEFNIQFSQKILSYSTNIQNPQKIYRPGFMLYFLYLPTDSSVIYYKDSDTIYLDY